jgi:hypothetical protein
LPKGYQGPVSGYKNHVGKYFNGKEQRDRESKFKVDQRPRLYKSPINLERNDSSFAPRSNETVAERLIRQGKEYKSKRSELRN